MRINKVEINGFRGLLKDEFQLQGLEIFQGEMGQGKTSRLLAILYGLTGAAPPNLNLDDLINIDSEFMWVKVVGEHDGLPFSIERRKRRGKPSTTRREPEIDLEFTEKMFIEGREIAKLFAGAPSEKALKLDALLGLSAYDQVISELSTAPVDRRINDLEGSRKLIDGIEVAASKRENLKRYLSEIESKLNEVETLLSSDSQRFSWADNMRSDIEKNRTAVAEVKSKQDAIGKYRSQVAAIKPYSETLNDQLAEIEARHRAMERRSTFLEAATQTLDLEGKRIEEITNCPLCGNSISPKSLEVFQHYEQEHKELSSRIGEVSSILSNTKARVDQARSDRDKADFLKKELLRLEEEVSEASTDLIPEAEVQKAENLLKIKDDLTREKSELEIKQASLRNELGTLDVVSTQSETGGREVLDRKLQALMSLRNLLQKTREALTQALTEVRSKHFNYLKTSFRETFKKIYPYQRFLEVDFETVPIRGKETLVVKAKTGEEWIYSHQMSTGENVAISFAILFALNQMEETPILLLDEPEEGLDENGISGLSETLNRVNGKTQVVVATRSPHLAQLLSRRTEEKTLT